MKWFNSKAISLAEVLITVAILGICVTSILMFYTNAKLAQQYASGVTVASTHAERILEEMKQMQLCSIYAISNYQVWMSPFGLQYLKNESINVQYSNISSREIQVTVTVSWFTNLRAYSTSLVTRIFK